MNFELPELDRKETQKAVEAALEKYRIFKHIDAEEREANITSSSEERLHGSTNEISDQTGSIATHNVDNKRYRQDYCRRIESAVKRLPNMERALLEMRYMSEEADYITDQHVFEIKFNPPLGKNTYAKIRWKAFYKLAFTLNLAYTIRQ